MTAMLAAGLVVTLNTDDPAYFRTTLTDELALAHRVYGFDRETLLGLQAAALDASYADRATRTRIRAALAAA